MVLIDNFPEQINCLFHNVAMYLLASLLCIVSQQHFAVAFK